MKTRITVKNRGVKVFDIVEIPGCSDPFRRLFLTGERILLRDSESTRSVVRFGEKQPSGAIKNGKMPVQKRVENYVHDQLPGQALACLRF